MYIPSLASLAVLVTLFAAVPAGAGSDAFVLCARKNKPLVLRTDGCKPRETAIPVTGPEGPQGPPGAPGPATSELPEGVTLRGHFALSTNVPDADAGQRVFTAISFGLTANVQTRYVGPSTEVAECPGTAEVPAAAPGYLCVYEIERSNVADPFVCPGETPFLGDVGTDCPAADSFGAVVGGSAGAGRVTFVGSWAVTSAGIQ